MSNSMYIGDTIEELKTHHAGDFSLSDEQATSLFRQIMNFIREFNINRPGTIVLLYANIINSYPQLCGYTGMAEMIADHRVANGLLVAMYRAVSALEATTEVDKTRATMDAIGELHNAAMNLCVYHNTEVTDAEINEAQFVHRGVISRTTLK